MENISSKEFNNQAAILHVKGELEEAKQLYEKALQLDEKNALALNNYGFLLLQKGRFEAAVENLLKSIALDPESDQAHINLGNSYLALNKYEDAEKHIKKSLELNPSNPLGWESYANFFMLLQQAADAAQSWYQAALLRPDNINYRLALADCLSALGQFNEAIEQLKDILSMDKAHEQALTQLGINYLKRKDFRIAQEYFLQTLSNYPENIKARYHLCLVYLSLGEASSALTELKRILIIDPHNVKARTDIAVLYLSSRQLKLAQQEIKRALELDPQFSKATYYHGLIIHQMGDDQQAKEILKSLYQHTQDDYGEKAKNYLVEYLSGTKPDNEDSN